jgi:hypothetical protein
LGFIESSLFLGQLNISSEEGLCSMMFLSYFQLQLTAPLNLSYTEILFPWHTNLSKLGESIVLWSLSRSIYKQRVSPANESYIVFKYFLAAVNELVDFHKLKFTVIIAD